MALKPTIYKFRIALTDINRDYYDSFNLTVAQHPSENEERMMARIVAFALTLTKTCNLLRGSPVLKSPIFGLKP